ncbi:hypothetical protein D3C83_288390 [compost metagenome]
MALALQGGGLWLCLHRYWAGGGLEPVRAMARFAPVPGVVTGIVLGFAALTAGTALAAARLEGRRPA